MAQRYVVRYGAMRQLGAFSARDNVPYVRGDEVVVRTPRGLEVGEILIPADADALERLSGAPHGQVLRKMTSDDINEWAHIQREDAQRFETCQRHVRQLGLNMDLVDVEHLFGGERVIVYYVAEQRVDFRELVRKLASEFQTRIEMRQIGVRDEARLLADYGDCGKPVCCNTHLTAMPPVSMRMAKIQKSTLDPAKISGRCGRLKCCLRYEFPVYEEMQRELPPIGSDIVTDRGRARVLGHEILAQQLLVQTEDNRRLLVPLTEVLSVIRRPSRSSNKPRSTPNKRSQPARQAAASGHRKPAPEASKSSDGNREASSDAPRPDNGRSDGRSSPETPS